MPPPWAASVAAAMRRIGTGPCTHGRRVGAPRIGETISFIGDCHGIDASLFANALYTYEDAEAVRHLFRVISSLDSMVVGETQIVGQVKTAFESARSADTA